MTINIECVGDAPDNGDFAPMWHDKTETIVAGHFSSPEAFVRWINEQEAKRSAWCTSGKGTDYEYQSFSRTNSVAEASDLILNGWKEGAAKAEALRDRINTANPVMRKEVQFAVAGALPDVPRYLSGNPKNMRKMADARNRKRPVITLYVPVQGSAVISADFFLRRAAVIAAVVDAIEGAGFSCHVVAWATSRVGGLWAETSVTVKEAGQHVDIARLAFGLGHPSFLRRLVFRYRANMASLRPIGDGMGSSYYGEYTCQPGTYCLPAIDATAPLFKSDEKAETEGLKATIDSLVKQGCPAFPE